MRLFIKLAVFAIVAYLIFITARPWVKYYIFKNAFVKAIGGSVMTTIPRNIDSAAKDMNIGITYEDDVEVTEYVNKLNYRLEYSESVMYPFGQEVEFDYTISVDRNIKDEKED
ncbi:hypothetical protein [Limisalsivibrio acetivorans]|uniref:hypothetical protein n=1 Tax=Limisalsivibrio acetivorans TaxID=1304888 RepID=UPI0003B7AD8F|nr:hypothetical protein [Limisalsivibrio acetivorans]